ncbi:XIAP-associated factor 1 isoform X2 [Poeciliopsis prolifica]|uniref:XIAP-associated factor 1 isoform X2 n=1 Tax=Poeciliopsis prolifica TaxID=188132 RepID=UPI0024138B25|nr:XIAP-associated factor 1 isoform X2 [Poeciliopsis prolifica]
MDNTEPTRTCETCHKEVAEANFPLHESHCKRFLSVCPDCDEAVPKDQLSQHREEQHTQVKCSKCNKKIERCHLEDHEAEECLERLQKCMFCELEVPWKQLEEHTVMCGSRTELCQDCGRYVKLSDQSEHSSTCSAADGEDSTQTQTQTQKNRVSCSNFGRSFLEKEIDHHEVRCYQESKLLYEEVDNKEEKWEDKDDLFKQQSQDQLRSAYKSTSQSHEGTRGPWVSGDQDQISTCPHCHLALPVSTLKWHEAKCRVHAVLKDREG